MSQSTRTGLICGRIISRHSRTTFFFDTATSRGKKSRNTVSFEQNTARPLVATGAISGSKGRDPKTDSVGKHLVNPTRHLYMRYFRNIPQSASVRITLVSWNYPGGSPPRSSQSAYPESTLVCKGCADCVKEVVISRSFFSGRFAPLRHFRYVSNAAIRPRHRQETGHLNSRKHHRRTAPQAILKEAMQSPSPPHRLSVYSVDGLVAF